MQLEHLASVTDDPAFDVVKQIVREYHDAAAELERQNIKSEYREAELDALRESLTMKIEAHRRDLLADAESELAGLRETYLKKMEKPSDVLARIEEYRIKYSPLTDEALDQAAHDYISGTSDILDRVEITSITGELENRGSKRLGDFREAVARRGGLEPWNRLAGDLPQYRDALRSASWGSLPIRVKSGNGARAVVEVDLAEYLK